MTNPGSAVTGRLVYADTAQPIHNLVVELYGSVEGAPPSTLASGRTDLDGRFSLPLPAGAPACFLRGMDSIETYAPDGAPLVALDEAFRRPVDPARPALGELPVAFWPYHPDRPVARAARGERRDPSGAPTTDQQHSAGYLRVLAASVATVMPIAEGLGARLAGGEALTLQQIQSAFPETLTQRIDRFADHTRSDAWLGELLLNGFNTALLGVDAKDPSTLRLGLHWGDVPLDAVHDLSDADILLHRAGDGLLPVCIRLRTRTPGAWSVPEFTEHRPTDLKTWELAKRAFRACWLLSGALDGHIIRTHLFTEQFALAAYRNLRRNPLRRLLLPHLQEVVAADTDADEFAFGENGQIPRGSALIFPVMEARMQAQLGGMDWWGWSPREPVTSRHKFARVQLLFWELAETYVRRFLDENADEIRNHWVEIRRFSDDLVAHSPPWTPPVAAPGMAWVDTNEVASAAAPRRTVNGAVRAITPVTSSDQPGHDDLARLAQLCTYALTQITFVHTWVHDGQYDVGGDIGFASIALRNGSLGAEDNASVGPLPSEAIGALVTNSNGLGANYGFLLANEAGDVPPALRSLLTARSADFAALGFDVRRIRSRINI